jgi:hypothetical protein
MTSPKTYYLTVTGGTASLDRDYEYMPHFSSARSFGPYTLKGAARIERALHKLPENIVKHRIYSSGRQLTVYRAPDSPLFSLLTQITNNYSPVQPTKGSPLNYM